MIKGSPLFLFQGTQFSCRGQWYRGQTENIRNVEDLPASSSTSGQGGGDTVCLSSEHVDSASAKKGPMTACWMIERLTICEMMPHSCQIATAHYKSLIQLVCADNKRLLIAHNSSCMHVDPQRSNCDRTFIRRHQYWYL